MNKYFLSFTSFTKKSWLRRMSRVILVALIIGSSFSIVSAQKVAVLEFFHGAECSHCHDEKAFFPTLKIMYPDLEIKEYEIWHNEESKLFAKKRLKELGTRLDGVPTNIIGEEVIVGFNKNKLLQTLEKHYGKPAVAQEEAAATTKEDTNSAKKWVLGAILLVIVGGAFYSFFKK